MESKHAQSGSGLSAAVNCLDDQRLNSNAVITGDAGAVVSTADTAQNQLGNLFTNFSC